jgi:hypothetical protein
MWDEGGKGQQSSTAVRVFIFERGVREPRWLSGLRRARGKGKCGLIKDGCAGLQRNDS